jgi:hypothetical protein
MAKALGSITARKEKVILDKVSVLHRNNEE